MTAPSGLYKVIMNHQNTLFDESNKIHIGKCQSCGKEKLVQNTIFGVVCVNCGEE